MELTGAKQPKKICFEIYKLYADWQLAFSPNISTTQLRTMCVLKFQVKTTRASWFARSGAMQPNKRRTATCVRSSKRHQQGLFSPHVSVCTCRRQAAEKEDTQPAQKQTRCSKCLQLDPSQRFQTAQRLSQISAAQPESELANLSKQQPKSKVNDPWCYIFC